MIGISLWVILWPSLVFGALDEQPFICMIGDSLIASHDWDASFEGLSVKNYGRIGEKSRGVIKQVSGIAQKRNIQKVFIMVGINDLWHSSLRMPGRVRLFLTKHFPAIFSILEKWIFSFNHFMLKNVVAPKLLNNYEALIRTIQTSGPETEIYIHSLLPLNEALFYQNYENRIDRQLIRDINEALSELALKYDVLFVDLYSSMTTPEHQLPAHYTEDGIHLNGAGYQVWENILRPLIES